MSESNDPRLSALYRRLPADEPDAGTDRRILDAAHAAVSRGSRHSYVPWAIAASLVLAAGIGLRVLHEAPVRVADPMPMPVQQADSEAVSVPERSTASREGAPSPVPVSPFKQLDTLEQAQRPGTAGAPQSLPSQMAPAAVISEDRVDTFKGLQKRRSESTAQTDCQPPALPGDDASRDAWQRAIARARAEGDAVLLECLERGYRQRFGKLNAPQFNPQAPDR
ncbi:MAG: hypothetical protein KDI82_00975 [Gammaproteobacteria bacterium]|nr:hypothetical protein [Gammaproteobacteria bacterium]